MNRVLKGEAVGVVDMALPLVVCAAIAAAGIMFVARQLRTTAIR